jgi:hypothetical protein
MRKMLISVVGLFVCSLLFSGCASPYPVGTLYTNLKLPVSVTSNQAGKGEKVGTAECQSILALVATGDASVQTAMNNAGITKIHHVDWEVENILGIIGKYKVTVYGE